MVKEERKQSPRAIHTMSPSSDSEGDDSDSSTTKSSDSDSDNNSSSSSSKSSKQSETAVIVPKVEVPSEVRTPKKEPQRIQQSVTSYPILQDFVKNPEEYNQIKSSGPLSINDIDSGCEYYIFRFPVGMLNPAHLAETELSLSSKTSAISVNNRPFEVTPYKHLPNTEAPSIFLPDHRGRLRQADIKISSQVVMKQLPPEVILSKMTYFDINDLRSTIHQPPEIKARNFFSRNDTHIHVAKTGKLVKEKKDTKILKKMAIKDKRNLEECVLIKEEGVKSEKYKIVKKEKNKLKEETKVIEEENVAAGRGDENCKKTKHKKEKKKRKLDQEDYSPMSSPKKKIKKEKHNWSPAM